jgi:NAD(P)-dependent dehydrogenase (short-subunit alcohol dehydrogenase family)
VTGGGSGIGRGLAMALAAEGASVVIADILEERAGAVAHDIERAGGSALAVACDVSERSSVRALKTAANKAFGTVSLLFANAGATCFERLTDMSEEDVDWIVQVNLLGVSNCLMAFLPDMIAAREGHVVATASMAGLIPAWIPLHVPYVAAKAGVIGMMLNLRSELSGSGIGCTVVCPGGVTSRITDSPGYRPERFGGPSRGVVAGPDDFAQSANLHFRPPEEVARMVLLAMQENRPLVLTDSSRRDLFLESYVNPVLSAFDDAAAFDKHRS